MKSLIIIVALLLATNCASKMPATYTPQTKQLYVLTDVVNAVGELGLAAENAVPANILPLPVARAIVQFCLGANTTIGQVPNGWYATVNASYQQLKLAIGADNRNNFQYAFDAFDVILNSFAPPVIK